MLRKCDWFLQKNNSKLIHLSSTSVYGKQTEIVDETCEKNTLNPNPLMQK